MPDNPKPEQRSDIRGVKYLTLKDLHVFLSNHLQDRQ